MDTHGESEYLVFRDAFRYPLQTRSMFAQRPISRGVVSGTAAGAFASFLFTWLHGLLISDIWSTLPLMLVAGAACGGSVAWTYVLTARNQTLTSWLRFNAAFVAMFVLLGIASLATLEPFITMGEVLAAEKPPPELFRKAMPLSIVFTAASIAALSWVYARAWLHVVAIAVSCILLVALLGLNVALIGLVFIPSSSFYLVGELFLLILALNGAYAAAFAAFQHIWMRRTQEMEVGVG